MERGDLVPDAVVIGVAEERLRRPDAAKGFILDGFPRTAAQAEALDRMLERLGVRLERCVALRVDEDELVRRLLKRAAIEGRSDDNEETIRKRMRVYREQTQPLVDYYARRRVLREVDGLGGVDEVAARIREALAP
jgi:adenylate kinase